MLQAETMTLLAAYKCGKSVSRARQLELISKLPSQSDQRPACLTSTNCPIITLAKFPVEREGQKCASNRVRRTDSGYVRQK